MEEKLLQIINHYGINHQQRKLQEEVFELQEAITRTEYPAIAKESKPDELKRVEKSNIIEELADVCVLLEQFKLFYDINTWDVQIMMEQKIKRTIERMKGD